MDDIEQIDEKIRELYGDGSDWAKSHRRYLNDKKRFIRLKRAREKGTHTNLEWFSLGTYIHNYLTDY